jgi:DNA-binding transcriptional ArsR family regulator
LNFANIRTYFPWGKTAFSELSFIPFGGFLKMAEWTFLTNHALVLSFLAKQPLITARELSMEIGITERAVRKIIADLDIQGYIKKTKEGRRVRYIINPKIPLRHKTQRDKAVGDLLKVLGWRREKADKKSEG